MSTLDRLKLARFVVKPSSRFTQGELVAEYEKKMARYVGCRFAVFVSSGSTANSLLAMRMRDTCDAKRDTVILPAVTWTTSCSPWIREGFIPEFIDISRQDFAMDTELLEFYLRKNASRVACVFVTSLLGFCPALDRLTELGIRFKVPIMLDNCEAAMSRYDGRNVSAHFTSTISTYFSHHFQSVEGGFVLTSDPDLHQWLLMARDHGLTRSLKDAAAYANADVDPRFDFNLLGSNFRNTEFNAMVGLLDFEKAENHRRLRLNCYETFKALVDPVKWWLPLPRRLCDDVPFAIPLLANNRVDELRPKLVALCESMSIESRPLISGNLLRHTAYKRFSQPGRHHLNASIVNGALYVGLGGHIPTDRIKQLAEGLNKL